MNKKSILTILVILILPVAVFWWLSSGKNSVADANTNMPQVIKFSSTMCLECKEVEKIFKEKFSFDLLLFFLILIFLLYKN